MRTAVPSDQTALETVYLKELDQFEHALTLSESLLDEVKAASMDDIALKVAERQNVIDRIKTIETERKELQKTSDSKMLRQYREKIAGMANKLVEIDDKIYKILQDRKIKFVQKHSTAVSDSRYSKRSALDQQRTTKIVDIRQK